MPPVYAGQYLRVDLSSGAITTHTIAEDDVRRFLLGSGYAAWLFFREVDPALPSMCSTACSACIGLTGENEVRYALLTQTATGEITI